MKKFAFKYERILQVRIDKENEVKNKLGKVNQLILDKESELDEVVTSQTSFLNQINQSMKEGILASDLQSIAANKSYLTKRIEGLNREIILFKEERVRIQKELLEANKQRKIMEKLKEKELIAHKALELQEESKIVDQIVTYQSTNRRE